ncbi:MAG: ribulose-phosphate 3-epimerase [Bacilli bacterium]|nr:ribulose-phosphate 3-epimerase [Bacilli bacterium]
MRPVYIAPSLLSVNKNDLQSAINQVVALGAKYIHFDVMDKKFIGHESFSFDDFSRVKKMHHVLNDVHLMTADPYEYAKEYAKRGAEIITFHYEAVKDDVTRVDCIDAIRKLGVKVGMSIKPRTPVEKIIPFLPMLDQVLIMSVEPGLGGQSFMPDALNKIKQCREYIDANHLKTLIEVDGGINDITGHDCYVAGADLLVMGTYLFGHADLKDRYQKIIVACQHG